MPICTTLDNVMLAFGLPGPWEWIIVLFIALLLFGRRLPEVARSMGKGIVEFKKGMHGIEDELKDIKKETSEITDASESPERLANTPTPTPAEAGGARTDDAS